MIAAEKDIFEKVTTRQIQLCCMLVLGIVACAAMLLGRTMWEPMNQFGAMCVNLAGAVFLGASLREHKHRMGHRLLLLGLLFCGWTALLQIYDFRYYSVENYYDPRFRFGAFLAEYMMLLPFAGIADEKEKATGLKILGGCYVAAASVLALMAAMLYAGVYPASLSNIFNWQGYRLNLMWHPNVLAGIFLLGIGMSLYFLLTVKKLWLKLLLGALTAVLFICSAVTNCRACNIMICCLLGGLVFFLIYRHRSVGRFLAGLLAAVLTAGVLFFLCMNIYRINCEFLTPAGNAPAAMEDVAPAPVPQEETAAAEAPTEETLDAEAMAQQMANESGQGSLADNLSNFNGRTGIWKAAFQALAEHPQTLIVGSRNLDELVSPYNYFPVEHMHNAWIQALMGLGLVGFLIVAAITVLAIKSCLMLFFFKKSTLAQKMVGVLIIAIMGTEFFEPYLFYTAFPYNMVQMLFLCCVGYVIYWDACAEKLN